MLLCGYYVIVWLLCHCVVVMSLRGCYVVVWLLCYCVAVMFLRGIITVAKSNEKAVEEVIAWK